MFFPDTYEFFCPTKIHSGMRALEQIPFELDILNARKPLIMTDSGTARKGVLKKVAGAFRDSGTTVSVFDDVPPVPDLRLIRDLAKGYRDAGCDSIIMVGGGTVADAAKALNIVVSGRPEDLKAAAGEDLLEHPLGPLLFVPTLSGTGFEGSRFATLEGMAFSSPFLMPDLVVIDPRMMTSEPISAIVSTAMIALVHCAEAYTCPAKNPMTDTYAYAGMRFIREHLMAVIETGDKGGRLALANAAAMGGVAFSSTPRGIIHELGWALGDHTGLPHGICMEILLPYGLEYRMDNEEYHLSDLLLPVAGAGVYADTAEGLRGRKAVNVVYEMQHDIGDAAGGGVPLTLKGAGIAKDALFGLAGAVAGKRGAGFSVDDCMVILEHAWEGAPITS